MGLIGLAVVLALSLALAPLPGVAQQAGNVYPIGYLTGVLPISTAHRGVPVWGGV
jgi:hypothetical protein